MRTRNTMLLAVAVIVLIVVGTTVALTHHAPLDLGLGRQATPAPQPIGSPPAPPVAAAGSATPRNSAQPVTRRAVRSSSAGRTPAAPGASRSGSSGYPGQVTCASPDVPSSTPYAWQCTPTAHPCDGRRERSACGARV